MGTNQREKWRRIFGSVLVWQGESSPTSRTPERLIRRMSNQREALDDPPQLELPIFPRISEL